jgi:hypothetical protein
MPLRTTTDKAFRQLLRGDAENVGHYRAELRYFHVPQRAILGMTNAYAVLDEAFTWSRPSDYYQGTRPVPQVPGASAYKG